jgi:hypothetical protein
MYRQADRVDKTNLMLVIQDMEWSKSDLTLLKRFLSRFVSGAGHRFYCFDQNYQTDGFPSDGLRHYLVYIGNMCVMTMPHNLIV